MVSSPPRGLKVTFVPGTYVERPSRRMEAREEAAHGF